MIIPKYNELSRTKGYLRELRRWASDIDSYMFGNPDSRDFPQNKKGDIVMILKTTEFYYPYEDEKWDGGGHIERQHIRTPKNLALTRAKVMGPSGIDYYCPWEEDLRLICADGKERYVDAGDSGGSFIFLPHPEMWFEYENINQFLPAFCHIDGRWTKRMNATCAVNKILRNYYDKLKKEHGNKKRDNNRKL